MSLVDDVGFTLVKGTLGSLIPGAASAVPGPLAISTVAKLPDKVGGTTFTSDSIKQIGDDFIKTLASDVTDTAIFFDSFSGSEAGLLTGINQKVLNTLDPDLQSMFGAVGESSDIPTLIKNSISKITGIVDITGYSDLLTKGARDLVGILTDGSPASSIIIGLGKDQIGNVRIRDLINGDLSGVRSIPTSFVSATEAKFNKAFSLLGYALNADPKGLFHIGVGAIGNLVIVIADKQKILNDIDSIVDSIYAKLAVIGPEWYTLSPRNEILQAREKLHTADVRLTTVKSSVIETGAFEEATFDAAKQDIMDAENLVCNFKTDFERLFPGKPLIDAVQIIALLELLATKRILLERKQAVINAAKAALEDFIPNFQLAGGEPLAGSIAKRLNNVGAGLIQQLQEEIRSIIASMDADIKKNSEIQYMGDTKVWCIQLKVVLETAKITGRVVDDYLSNDPDGYKAAFEIGADASRIVTFPQFQQLINAIKAFSAAAEQKLRIDTPLSDIANIVSQIHALTAAERANNDSLSNAFSSFNGPTVSLVAGAIAMVEDIGMDRLASIVRTGDWNEFWKTTPDTATTTGALDQALTGALRQSRALGNERQLSQQSSVLTLVKSKKRSEQLASNINEPFSRDIMQEFFAAKLKDIQLIQQTTIIAPGTINA